MCFLKEKLDPIDTVYTSYNLTFNLCFKTSWFNTLAANYEYTNTFQIMFLRSYCALKIASFADFFFDSHLQNIKI